MSLKFESMTFRQLGYLLASELLVDSNEIVMKLNHVCVCVNQSAFEPMLIHVQYLIVVPHYYKQDNILETDTGT